MDTFETTWLICLLLVWTISCIYVGFTFGNSFETECIGNKTLDGLWTRNECGFKGDWVHVNVEGMSYERAIEVCKHETFHEIFAECGEVEDPEKCFDRFLDYKFKKDNTSNYN